MSKYVEDGWMCKFTIRNAISEREKLLYKIKHMILTLEAFHGLFIPDESETLTHLVFERAVFEAEMVKKKGDADLVWRRLAG
jgi:hypothetical protein